ncbi:uncharacterized protein LOC129749323 [Uranotaenia lowii]|uniref:uncharacterized protein LOC129749323 n=1 Tax=Uranotaenia lowii TaxID=190385 RepID=UPI002478DA57|nr:uncharacterized protein LOC129749323 [Uranotaenia lowii]
MSTDIQKEPGHSCGAGCNLPDNNRMVACDKCDSWWHYECVGVGDSISEKDFICPRCTATPQEKQNTIVPSPKSISSAKNSIKSAGTLMRLRLQKLEEMKALQEKQLDLEQRKLDLEKKFIQEKYRVLEEEADDDEDRQSRKSNQSNSSRIIQWKVNRLLGSAVNSTMVPQAQEKVAPVRTNNVCDDLPVGGSNNAEPAVSKQSSTLVTAPVFESAQQLPGTQLPYSTSRQMSSSMDVVNTYASNSLRVSLMSTGAIPKTNPITTTGQGPPHSLTGPIGLPSMTQPIVTPATLPSFMVSSGSVPPVVATSAYPVYIPSVPHPATMSTANNFQTQHTFADSVPVSAMLAPGATLPNPMLNPYENYTTPSHSQIAARQLMAKDLPMFSGDPEDWPLFSRMFFNTTQACGYSDADNLTRLQRCLRGPALEAVRSKLLLPNSVPLVMETLKILYGRPEILIFALINKVKNTPGPKPGRLDTLITFGMTVQNLVDHLAVGQHFAHMNNPTLIHKLVDKLPDQMKLDWALYKEQFLEDDLRVFATFMSVLVKAATAVTINVGEKPDNRNSKLDKQKDRGFLHTHTTDEVNHHSNEWHRNESSSDSTKWCKICFKSEHRVQDCSEFLKKNLEERWTVVHCISLCRTCLFQHGRRPCKLKKACGVEGCSYKHHPLLHGPKANQSSGSSSGMVNNHRHGSQSSLFRILPVTLSSRGRSVKVYAFYDDGSSLTLLEEKIANQLGLEGESGVLCLTWTADVTRDEVGSKWVNFDIAGEGRSQKYSLSNVRTVQNLSLPSQSLHYQRLAARYPHLSGLPVSDYNDVTPHILIGNDNAHLAVALRRREGKTNDPIATKTRLGWSIHGPISENTIMGSAFSMHICQCSSKLEELHDIIKRSFAVENLGVSIRDGPESIENQRARVILEATTKRVGRRFETGLLWRYDVFEFPDSYAMAFKRLICLEKRMSADAVVGGSVRRQISEYLEKGYLREATEVELQHTDPRRIWYLPLGVVINPKKPGKIRIFCDAAAKVDGVCLNSMLIKGPDQLMSLPKILTGFRERKVAVSADIREMFHRVLIREADVQAQRILWRNEPSEQPKTFFMTVATFGSTSSPCSVQHVKNINAREFATEFPEAVESILHHHYMDDYLQSFDDEAEAIKRSLEVKFIHSQAGFEFHSWSSNSDLVLQAVGETDPSTVKSFDVEDRKASSSEAKRVLGMLWLREEDAFTYSSDFKHIPENPTKREVLSIVMSLYDPLGLLAHFIIHGKILVQDIWRNHKSWDEPISENLQIRWAQWISLFPKLKDVRIPRPYFGKSAIDELGSIQLHVFVDASELAYACASYLRAEVGGVVKCILISAKSKVAPLKTLSIPRLELQAAIIGSRQSKNLLETHSLKISRRVIWTDSRTVLAWINSDSRKYNQFVSCRIGEILESTEAFEWKWVPSKLNVADEATKWSTGPDLSSEGRWFNGPSFLYEPEDRWPFHQNECFETGEELRQVKCNVLNVHRAIDRAPLLIKWENFSQWNRLIHSIGYVYRYSHNRVNTWKNLARRNGNLQQAELESAEKLLFRTMQSEAYAEEIRKLQQIDSPTEQRRLKRTSPLSKLSPFIDEDGILRVESRISAAAFVSYDTRNPIILPREHYATKLIVLWYHKKYLHCNTNTVVNEIRQRFHVSRIKTLVRIVEKQCTHCRVYKASPNVPRMSPLPAARLRAFYRPFSFVGLDYFGPMQVRVGRSTVKRWVALFTCLTIRAVHLEVVHSLTTTSCKMAMRRFVARRGSPVEIYSDNGTNFLGAKNDLVEECKTINTELATTFTNTVTKWYFNPPSAPHMGGAWERLVRSVKTAFFAITTSRTPNEETFSTVLVEAEAVVNSRPLTFISLENDSQEALTPNHFLLLSSTGIGQPHMKFVESRLALRDDWNHNRHLVDIFWHRWVKEYLPIIARRTKWFEETKPLEPGTLVVIIDESIRNGWTRGRVLDVVKGADGRVRRATVQTSKGLIIRPVAKLAVLDVGKTSEDHLSYEGEDVTATLTAPLQQHQNPGRLNTDVSGCDSEQMTKDVNEDDICARKQDHVNC